jgi:hypothetical protein
MPKKPQIDLTMLTEEQREEYKEALRAVKEKMRLHREAEANQLGVKVDNTDIKAAKYELELLERLIELDQAGKAEGADARIKELERELKVTKRKLAQYEGEG